MQAGDLVLEANGKMLLYANHHEMLLAFAESPDRVTLRLAVSKIFSINILSLLSPNFSSPLISFVGKLIM